jgi:hypothetical protein
VSLRLLAIEFQGFFVRPILMYCRRRDVGVGLSRLTAGQSEYWLSLHSKMKGIGNLGAQGCKRRHLLILGLYTRKLCGDLSY